MLSTILLLDSWLVMCVCSKHLDMVVALRLALFGKEHHIAAFITLDYSGLPYNLHTKLSHAEKGTVSWFNVQPRAP